MQKIAYPELFANFVGRESDLRQIERYHIYRPMYYRSNLFTHSKRVLWLLQSILPLVEQVFGNKFDSTKAQIMAVIHDDLEIVMGDILAGHKNKMSPAQLAEVAEQEKKAVAVMAARFPFLVAGYDYGELLNECQDPKTLEAMVLKYVDRFDAFGEALHEVHAGNRAFTTYSIHPELGKIELPIIFYQQVFANFSKKYPELENLLRQSHPLLLIPTHFEMENVVGRGQPHTKESVMLPADYAPYTVWKNIILAANDPEECENLVRQKEWA